MDKLIEDFYYVTAATGEKHIEEYAQYALRSLLKTGVDYVDVYCIVNTIEDLKIINKLVPDIINVFVLKEDLSGIKWRAHNGKRKYSVFKSSGLYRCFSKPRSDKSLVYFDTDVLFFRNPKEFLKTKSERTWFHHKKILEDVVIRKSRAGRLMSKSEVDVNNYESLSKWVSAPAAWCMIKNKAKKVPDVEAVAGFYLLHPKDHEKLLRMTYLNCLEIVKHFANHVDVGDQKPMNAALNILEIDWWCDENRLESDKYFDHFYGTKQSKTKFKKKIEELNL